MEAQKKALYWLWLRLMPGIGPVAQRRLLNHFQSPERIYEADEEALEKVRGIGPTLAQKVLAARNLDEARRLWETMCQKEIQLLTLQDSLYAENLRQDPLAPTVLFYRGELSAKGPAVGIVGSRKCSEYGKQVTVEAAQYLAQKGIAVVSGMAKGIDGYSHTACLKAGGRTLAFLGCGVDVCYPREHQRLMESIINQGAVLSEYLPGTQPKPEYFPRRNALISGWSDKLLVAEAAEKSGALITAGIAKSQGKEVLVPPHDLFRSTGKGTNRLLQEGATLYLGPDQLWTEQPPEAEAEERIPLEEWLGDPLKTPDADGGHNNEERKWTPDERKVLDALENQFLTIEELQKKTGIGQLGLLDLLTEMELRGMIKAIPGGRFSNR